MSQRNLIEVRIPEPDLAEIKAAAETLRTKLLPHLRTLTAQERLELPKMGDKTVAFVQKAYDYARANAALVPSFLDLEAMTVDLAAVQALREVVRGVEPVMDALHDTLSLSGSEAYQGALVFYNSVKSAAKSKAPGAANIYDDLSTRFPGAPVKKKVASS